MQRVQRMGALVMMLASLSQAQQGMVLRPDTFVVKRGGEAVVRGADVWGEKAQQIEWSREVAWFFVRHAGTQENRGAEDAPKPGVDRGVRVPLRGAGVAMIGVDVKPGVEEWEGERLKEFAARAGSKEAAVEGNTRVRRLVSATTLVRVDGEDGAAERDGTAVSKSGQQVEIRALMDPTATPAGGDMAVRVYVRGEAEKNGAVTAVHVESGTRQEVLADAKGIAGFRMDRGGEWRVEFHVLRALKEDEAAWMAASATLTFLAPAAVPLKGDGEKP